MLKWYGEEVTNKMIKATARAMNGLLADCVAQAKPEVPVRTATLQGSIQMRPVRMHPGPVLVGLWGSFNVNYALPVIKGTRPHEIRPSSKQALFWPGADHPVKVVHHPGTKGKDFLRPVADRLYPQLPSRIRRELR